MGVLNDIQNALNTKLDSLSGLPTIYWQNTSKEPIQGTNFIRATLLPAAGRLLTLNNENEHIGIYQVDIFTKINNGTSQALLLADIIREGFLRQSLITNTTIVHIQNISMSQAQRDESWWHMFVEINYFSVA